MTYYLPAEWELQSAILMAWPHTNSDWQLFLSDAEITFANIIREVAEDEIVVLACHDDKYVSSYLKNHKVNINNVLCVQIPTNDCWARDFGPITVFENNEPVLLDFIFNAWGNKYQLPLDNLITKELTKRKIFKNIKLQHVDLILEGGSIETDGKGTLLTTKQCLLSENRNIHLTQQDIEERLKECLGVKQVLWLSHGFIQGDDTDSHIDTIARFCNPEIICYQSCEDKNDLHYEVLQAMADELASFKNYLNKPYQLVPLPFPKPKYSKLRNRRLPATYANFLITNTKVIVPIYDDPADSDALKIISSCFPGRKIVGVNALNAIENSGSIHCLTMQLPVGVI